jgi:Na+/proline symporter
MIFTTWALKRYNGELQTSEAFSTAGRTVKSGLVAAAVVSSWTWAATLLQSSGVAYRYGVSGPFWYASGATVQILLFATIAIELKRRAPNAHTFLEVIKARYGVVAHSVYLTFGLMTNILVTAMLLCGGSAVASDLSGVPTAAACFLLPLGVVIYSKFVGVKAEKATDKNSHVRRYQGHFLDRLCSYPDHLRYHLDLCLQRLRYKQDHRITRQGL